jgi:hypothetical protein
LPKLIKVILIRGKQQIEQKNISGFYDQGYEESDPYPGVENDITEKFDLDIVLSKSEAKAIAIAQEKKSFY